MAMLIFVAVGLLSGLSGRFFGVGIFMIAWIVLSREFASRLGERNSCQTSFLLGLSSIEITHTFA